MGLIETRLEELGMTLPDAPAAVANYVPYILSDGVLFISGQISKDASGTLIEGTITTAADIDKGREAARACALNILAQAKSALGSLDRIKQIARLTGFVASASSFVDQPKVINGASDLIVEVLGDRGRHTRSAVGVASLPLGASVEIDAIILVSP